MAKNAYRSTTGRTWLSKAAPKPAKTSLEKLAEVAVFPDAAAKAEWLKLQGAEIRGDLKAPTVQMDTVTKSVTHSPANKQSKGKDKAKAKSESKARKSAPQELCAVPTVSGVVGTNDKVVPCCAGTAFIGRCSAYVEGHNLLPFSAKQLAERMVGGKAADVKEV